MFILLDANVTAAYYLPRSTSSTRVRARIETIFDSVRSGRRSDFFYLPNFCVAEVFSVFMKHAFGKWNSQVKTGTIDKRYYTKVVRQFEDDIHNGKFIYHYELSRYHVLGINLVAPIDHYFQLGRPKGRSKKPQGATARKATFPMGTFDHLIIAMGIHLAHIHGRDNVAIISADRRLTDVLTKCKTEIPANTRKKLRLDDAHITRLTGRRFHPSIFPLHANLATCSDADLNGIFGEWPLPVGKVPKVGRYSG